MTIIKGLSEPPPAPPWKGGENTKNQNVFQIPTTQQTQNCNHGIDFVRGGVGVVCSGVRIYYGIIKQHER